MGKAKDIVLRPVGATEANAFIRRTHYSGKVMNGSQIHLGVFYRGVLHGVMQFGPPMDRRNMLDLVEGIGWNEFIELNRLAFTDMLPRNSESRAISVALKMIRKFAPHIKMIISFADATQCGDGTIYRASGFVLTGIKENVSMVKMPDGAIVHEMCFGDSTTAAKAKQRYGKPKGVSRKRWLQSIGAEPLPGYQLRYIYFLDPSYRERLTVPELPYSEIERRGAGMYKGIKRGRGETDSAPDTNQETGGASPTHPLLVKHA